MKPDLKKLTLTTGVSLGILSAASVSRAATPNLETQSQLETLSQKTQLHQQSETELEEQALEKILGENLNDLDSSLILAGLPNHNEIMVDTTRFRAL